MKKLFSGISIAAVFLALASVASAHVVVKPATAGIGSYQTFTISVPSEKPMATVGVRLAIPAGLTGVTPTVKPGWTISAKKSGSGEDATTSEITWTGGRVPSGQRDEFSFSAKVPSTAGTIVWKAYQTYQDGTVVSWDMTPNAEEMDDDSVNTGPYSQTAIVDDLTPQNAPKDDFSTWAFAVAILALMVSCYSVIGGRIGKNS